MALTIPNIFKRKQIIPSAGFNENYEAIRSYMDTLEADIASGAALGDDSVSTANIQDDAITADKMADNSVATAALQDASVTAAKLASFSSWQRDVNTWTRVSNVSIKTSGDQTANFYPGRKLRYGDTTTKYAYVVSATFSGGETTATIYGGTSYIVVGNPTYVDVNFSDELAEWPNYFIMDPIRLGWSSYTHSYTYVKILGREATFWIDILGTSNSTSANLSIPTDVYNVLQLSETPYTVLGVHTDNGSAAPNGMARRDTDVIYFYPNGVGSSWTSSGTKRVIARLSATMKTRTTTP